VCLAACVFLIASTGAATGNAAPHRGPILPAPNLVHDQTRLLDADGNGYLDPGEEFGLIERVWNIGTARATFVSGALSATSPDVGMRGTVSAYPDIPAGGGGVNLVKFAGFARTSLRCGVNVEFSLELTTAQGSFQVQFKVPTAPCNLRRGPPDRARSDATPPTPCLSMGTVRPPAPQLNCVHPRLRLHRPSPGGIAPAPCLSMGSIRPPVPQPNCVHPPSPGSPINGTDD